MRWTLVALTPALLFLVASTASGQERSCAELCRLDPATVPPECVCAGDVSISSSSAESLLEMTAAELLEAEREYYSERMAPIDNYWVVVESNISPMAEVRYYEKEGTVDGDLPYFRMVPPKELAQRETLANPDAGPAERMAAENPASVLDAYAQAIDIIASNPEVNAETGGAASGLLGALADGFRDVGRGIEEQEEQDQEEEMDDLARQLWSSVVSVNLGWWDLPIEWAMYYPDGPTPAQRLGERFPRRFPVPDFEELGVAAGGIWCSVTAARVPFDWEGPDGTAYTIEHAERWLSFRATGGPKLIYQRIEARTVTATGFQRAVIEQETDRYRDDGPLIPHRTRRRIAGAFTEVLEVIKHVQSNTGPPTQVEIAEHTFGTVGVPGARPSAP